MILSLFGGAILPTGNRARGFGSGTTTFETFAAFDQLFPTNTFIQTQFGADLPRHTDIAPQSIFFNTAIGQSFGANHGLGRLWSPMFEFLAARDLWTMQKPIGCAAANAGDDQQEATHSSKSGRPCAGQQHFGKTNTSRVLPALGLV